MIEHTRLSRRRLIRWLGISGVALPVLAACGGVVPDAEAATFPVTHTDAQWRRLLTPAQYDILRQQGTELPYTSPLNSEHRRGTFVCAADGHRLYASATKFDSGTGWPSFYRALPRAIGTGGKTSIDLMGSEVHCARCGGHLGHVFDDGPPPTGLRYCMNGAAMKFVPG